MDTEEKTPTTMDYVDDIRAQFDKISKLSASLEDWERQADSTDMEAHHIEAARGILSAGIRMREALYKVERVAFTATEKHDEQTDKRLASFFES
jgi:ribosomal protein L16 Arg81 hydroxylase